jgi:hypothetical protein
VVASEATRFVSCVRVVSERIEFARQRQLTTDGDRAGCRQAGVPGQESEQANRAISRQWRTEHEPNTESGPTEIATSSKLPPHHTDPSRERRAEDGYHVSSAKGRPILHPIAKPTKLVNGEVWYRSTAKATRRAPSSQEPGGGSAGRDGWDKARARPALARNDRGTARRRAGVARGRSRGHVHGTIRWFRAATAPPIGTTDERQDGHQGQDGQSQTFAEHGTPRGDGRHGEIDTVAPSLTIGPVGAIAPTRPWPAIPSGTWMFGLPALASITKRYVRWGRNQRRAGDISRFTAITRRNRAGCTDCVCRSCRVARMGAVDRAGTIVPAGRRT